MATVGDTYLTLADLYKRQDEKGNVADIIELLAETNPILDDMIVVEANDGTTHLTTMRTGIPAGTFRRLYQAVQPTKSTTKQVRDATGMMENWSEIDAKLVDLSGNPAKLRLTEATAFLEGLNQTAAQRIFYGNTVTDPEEFLGLAPRFSSLSAENGRQIVDAGGRGNDNTSIWFVVWGENTVHGLYPKGSKGGIQRDDKGKQTKETAEGVYDVYREKFQWDLGLSVRDWRYVSRIANIDVSDMLNGDVQLYNFMRKAFYRLKQRRVTGGRAAIYANTDVLETLDALATNAGSTDSFVRLRPMEIEGKEVLTYRGIPIRETDALINTEARVE
jgi:hypothetical protein